MAPEKRHSYEAQFKLQAIGYEVVNVNRAVAEEFNINEGMVWKWRKKMNCAKFRRRNRFSMETKRGGHS